MADQVSLKCSVRARIISERHSAWKVAGDHEGSQYLKDVIVDLEIVGQASTGFNLVMTPEGCFTADNWFETQDDAMAAAEETFGASQVRWIPPPAGR